MNCIQQCQQQGIACAKQCQVREIDIDIESGSGAFNTTELEARLEQEQEKNVNSTTDRDENHRYADIQKCDTCCGACDAEYATRTVACASKTWNTCMALTQLIYQDCTDTCAKDKTCSCINKAKQQ